MIKNALLCVAAGFVVSAAAVSVGLDGPSAYAPLAASCDWNQGVFIGSKSCTADPACTGFWSTAEQKRCYEFYDHSDPVHEPDGLVHCCQCTYRWKVCNGENKLTAQRAGPIPNSNCVATTGNNFECN